MWMVQKNTAALMTDVKAGPQSFQLRACFGSIEHCHYICEESG